MHCKRISSLPFLLLCLLFYQEVAFHHEIDFLERLTVPMQIVRAIKNTNSRASHSWVQETLLPPK